MLIRLRNPFRSDINADLVFPFIRGVIVIAEEWIVCVSTSVIDQFRVFFSTVERELGLEKLTHSHYHSISCSRHWSYSGNQNRDLVVAAAICTVGRM